MSDVTRLSFGSWRVTRADPAFPALGTASVEIGLTPNDLVMLDDHGGSLGAWPIGEVALYVRDRPHEVRSDNEVAVLRLGAQRLEIKSIERHGSHRDSDLRDAIIERYGSQRDSDRRQAIIERYRSQLDDDLRDAVFGPRAPRPVFEPTPETLAAAPTETSSVSLTGSVALVCGLVVWAVLWVFGFMVLGSVSLPSSDPVHSADPILWAVMVAAFLGGPTLGFRVGRAISQALG
jgi:hypothetical protein